MKKKIVYISGAEVFNAKDVRAAFDEVRSTLGLDSDTILFGVPIDEVNESTENAKNESINQKVVSIRPEIIPETESYVKDEIVESVSDDTVTANSGGADGDAPVVPIQSILTSGTKKARSRKKTAEKPVEQDEPVSSTEKIDTDDTVVVAAPEEKDTNVPELNTEEESISIQDVQIEEMITDDVPAAPEEKTLEELLESMTPLREDVHVDAVPEKTNENNEEIDATLENLASEYVDTQAKIPDNKKSSARGKIGKLKGIIPLPFSKKNKDDTGIMGDLFGWAGFAANDDDFTIPGFFTNAAAKK